MFSSDQVALVAPQRSAAIEALKYARQQEAELVSRVKRKLPALREDGPALTVLFDDLPPSAEGAGGGTWGTGRATHAGMPQH